MPCRSRQQDSAVFALRGRSGAINGIESRRQAMTFKSMLGASVLVAAGLGLSGCQSTPPRSPTPAFTQRPGSNNPPIVGANAQNPQTTSPPTYNTSVPAGVGVAPSQAPMSLGSQSRSTAPYTPGTNSAPGAFNTNPTPPLGSPINNTAFDPSMVPPPSSGPALR
jgi:hypothetical protein